jgi:uncharacterized protein DUF4150
MGMSVEANGRSVLHKGHGMTHAAAVPDVCKTPSPGGPVPIPYPNFAMDSNLVDGASTVNIEGNPLANVKSKISTSTGDEPGSAGGIMSSVNKGTCTWKMGSPNVKAEGESVVRFIDTSFHNGNGFNTSWIDGGQPTDGYANDFDAPCPICGRPPEEHGIPSRSNTAAICAEIIRRLRDAAEQARVNQTPGVGGSQFMVAVMICACATNSELPNTFATMSNETSAAFRRIAGGVPGVHRVLMGGPANMSNFVTANTSGLATLEHKWLAVAAAVQEVEAELANGGGTRGYNEVGQCAGAKLLARSGHGPIEMTEMIYQSQARQQSKAWEATYEWRSEGVRVDGGRRFTIAQGGAIGSCNTCQRTLYLTMCPKRVCTKITASEATN